MALINQDILQTLDEQTAELIIRLQLQDIDACFSSSKGKGRENEISDQSLALQVQAQELRSVASLCRDKRMARSIAKAVYADEKLLAAAVSQEDIERRDHEIASQLNNGLAPSTTCRPKSDNEAQSFEDELIDKLGIIYMSGADSAEEGSWYQEETGKAESSSQGARTTDRSSLSRRCEACREFVKFIEIARAPCRHEYCHSCLQDLFEASMTDESLFPPRCCRQTITIESVRVFLKPGTVQSYEKKKVEFGTPNRTYCYSSTCSAFIEPSQIEGDVAACPNCRLTTCTICKAKAHKGDCPNDTTLHQVLEVARQNGWQRCYSCSRLVELDHGCNHITFVTVP